MIKIIHKWKTFKTAVNLSKSRHPSKFTPVITEEKKTRVTTLTP